MSQPEFATFSPEPVHWYYGWTFDAESWGGKKSSREEAIEAALASADDEIGGFWIASGALSLPTVEFEKETVSGLLIEVDQHECWYEDCGLDAAEEIKRMDEPEGLRTFLNAALQHWIANAADLSANRMIADFLAMEFYRVVKGPEGTFSARLLPDFQAGDEEPEGALVEA